jgi:hypothetical protein
MRFFYSFLLLLTLSLPLTAQTAPPLTNRLNEMKKLDYMVGQWKGTGWMDSQGGRQTFSGMETVQNKLNGLALLIEGNFKNKEGAVVHETLAVLSYDEKAKNYNFRTYLANGAVGDYVLNLIEGGWQWSIQYPQGGVRFTFKLTDKGEWFEIGEFSQDGKTWRKFFEMTLQRVKQ